MCGLAGYFGALSGANSEELLQRMGAALAHRGPDGAGQWQDVIDDRGRVGLAHRRLAVIDLHTGSQPLRAVQGRYHIVFNGEIYNYVRLRQTLEDRGYYFATRSDTEVIPAAVDCWGATAAVQKLRGMFAFALYDAHERSLLLARDRVGIKPLYWARRSDGSILFASEIKALLQDETLPRRCNVTALLDFFTLGAPLSPHTAFADVYELAPGTWQRFRFDAHHDAPHADTVERFYQWQPAVQEWQSDDAVAAIAAALKDAITAHLTSDVPVGAFLSGGIDSTLLVSFLREVQTAPAQTFTAAFGDTDVNELPLASLAAGAVGVAHNVLQIPDRCPDPQTLCMIIEHCDQPLGDSSLIPTWLLCQHVRSHTQVVLGGDGGDEIFLGYPRYLWAQLLAPVSRLPLSAGALDGLSVALRQWAPRRSQQLRKAAELLAAPRGPLLAGLHTYFTSDDLGELFPSRLWQHTQHIAPTWTRLWQHVTPQADTPVQQLRSIDINGFLHADYLRKVDMASGAHGVEVRLPYLDNDVLALGATMPVSVLLHGGQSKAVLRQLAAQRLPAAVAAGSKKGFTIPFDRWTDTPPVRNFLHHLLLGPTSPLQTCTRRAAVQKLWNDFLAPQTAAHSRFQVYQRIFFLTSLALWLRRWQPQMP